MVSFDLLYGILFYHYLGRISILKTLLPLRQGRIYNYIVIVKVSNVDSTEAGKIVDLECKECIRCRGVLVEEYR